MPRIFLFALLLTLSLSAIAQQRPVKAPPGKIKIHSHNDYDHTQPFWDAYEQRAFSIEADVYLRGDSLMVAHQASGIKPGHTLETMYLQPVSRLFEQYQGKVSNDDGYTFYLMIDIKESWQDVLPLLIRRLEQHRSCFDRSHNPMAVQVFISGNRPPDSTFRNYPSLILFDGLPGHRYAPADLRKVVMISDNFETYSNWNGKGRLSEGGRATLRRLVMAAAGLGKPFRFWGAPDTPEAWRTLQQLGPDMVINTDRPGSCRNTLTSAPGAAPAVISAAGR
ncbi:phosphatidylinositol-specific phospholipase C/glycerophosphodiester phosphodiesterase family protein [Compostibacter hankyongensis]|uniref:Glycerophosphodiester phosphodiesterase n=1 Tax=Compostibacter hankyongensis TaxID=1007089 RepID=A0ABP8G2P7_9BACT